MAATKYFAIRTANSTYLAERIGETDSFTVQGPVDSFVLHGLPYVGIPFEYDGYMSRKRTSPVRSVTRLTRKQYEAA